MLAADPGLAAGPEDRLALGVELTEQHDSNHVRLARRARSAAESGAGESGPSDGNGSAPPPEVSPPSLPSPPSVASLEPAAPPDCSVPTAGAPPA